jgi:RNA polymerase sigma-70 factor (ECF subfamily)
MSETADDSLLMRRLQSGDRAALAELYDRHAALAYGVALRILRHAEDAEDALQESWVQVWNRSDSFDPARGSVAAWVITIARSRALDRLRRKSSRGRAESAAGIDPPATPAAPDTMAERAALRDHLGRAMEGLEARQREVLEIAYFEGLSQSEIAERLKVPLGTVKYWMRQGLLHLRQDVAEELR